MHAEEVTVVVVDTEGVVALVGGLLGMAALVAFGFCAGRYHDEPLRHGSQADQPLPPARITAGTHLLLALVLIGALAMLTWLVAA